VILWLPGVALGDTVDWSDTTPESGVVVGSEVEFEGPGTFRLITIEDLGVVGNEYAVSGSVRYMGVDDVGYLEMWSFFDDGGAYFSRTLANEGPQALISGSSSGRDFVLPFSLNGAEGPTRVEINLVLPAGGTVWVGPLSTDGFGGTAHWWSERTSSVIGASLGVMAGLMGALVGILSGRRRARRVVVGLLIAGAVVGAVGVLAGGAAVFWSQPRHVWYPLVLVGGILVVVDGALLPATRRAYAAAELHRMRALDAT
jgi:hypothetical protein